MKRYDTCAGVLAAVARLQEFYDNTILHAFYHRCEERDVETIEAFLMLHEIVIGEVTENGRAPTLESVAEGVLAALSGTKAGDGTSREPSHEREPAG